MHVFAVFMLAAMACLAIHLAGATGAGLAFGIHIQEVRFGLGPRVFSWGRVGIGLLPIGGFVRFATAAEGNARLPDSVLLDLRPVWQQILLALAGCLALLFVAAATLGLEGLRAFVDGFGQIVSGAISLDDARDLLKRGAAFAAQAPLAQVIGLVAAKMAALNLLPLPATSGGIALHILGRASGLDRAWSRKVTVALVWVYVVMCLVWVLAFASLYLLP